MFALSSLCVQSCCSILSGCCCICFLGEWWANKQDVFNLWYAVGQLAKKSNTNPCIWLDHQCQPSAFYIYFLNQVLCRENSCHMHWRMNTSCLPWTIYVMSTYHTLSLIPTGTFAFKIEKIMGLFWCIALGRIFWCGNAKKNVCW